jgi:anti-repressor protein
VTTAVEVFQFPATGQEIRTVIRDGEPLFCVADVCRGLQHTNPSVALKLTDGDDRVKVDLRETDNPNLNRASINPEMWFVTESGFFALALASQAPGAKKFRRWVTHDVLPTIRKTGSYSLAVPRSLPEALRAYAAEVESHESTRAELAAAEPKADAWDALASLDGDYSARDAAFILNRDPAISTGQNRLIVKLREFQMTDGRGIPYARHANHLNLMPTSYENRKTGTREPSTQIRVTVEGVRYLHKRMGGIRQPAFADLVRKVSS